MNKRFAAVVFAAASTAATPAATLPTGFTETALTTSLSAATAMALSPDGRIFVCQQGGALRVIKNGTLLSAPFLTVTVNALGERGLLGVAFDPAFPTNNFVYVYYTTTTPAFHNRVSRFTASGDVAVAGSEVVLLELDDLSSATNHNGGALHFGPDGKLYIAVGENANGNNSQTLSNLLGKILRINADGTIPVDNPFYATTTGRNRAIWALGLRNPFTFGFQNGTARMFINDVGQSAWEEINDGIRGANYGWPTTEGETTDSRFTSPLFVYGHGSGATAGCAIAGGAFYNPPAVRFPSSYVGQYFFADYCSGWIRTYDPAADTAAGFASAAGDVVDLEVSSSGKLYYLNRSSLFEIDSTANDRPQVTTDPLSQTRSVGQSVSFSVTASGTAPLTYQWERNTVAIPGATSPTYTIASVAMADNGAQFRCTITNTLGSVTSNSATLTVVANRAPTAMITLPAAGNLYTAGQTITFAGTGTDPEDGALPASAYTWTIDFHHDTHTHPALLPTSGITTGTYTIPDSGETSANVFYRIYLTVRDSAGLTTTTSTDLLPRKVTVILNSLPGGAQLTLDGEPVIAPFSFVGVVGMKRIINAPSPQTINALQYSLRSWSDNGAQMHLIATPSADTTYTAEFTETPLPAGLIGYWSFDENSGGTARDTSGSGYNATVNAATWTTGRIHSALSFNGTTSHVVTPGISLANAFSVSAWVNPAVTTQAVYARIAETRYSGGMYLGTDASGRNYKFIVNNGRGSTSSCRAGYGCAQGGTVAAGWHLVTATFDGVTATLYVDNTVVASDSFTALPNTAYALYIGRYFGGNGSGWNGAIDEVRLYNRALSSADVSLIYDYTGVRGLIGHWSFDENSGSIARDTSGSGHNAAVNAATWTTGRINSALSFNGTTSYVVTPGISLANAFSVSAWVNPAVTTQAAYARIAETRYNGGLYLGTDVSGRKYKFIVNTGLGAGSCGAGYGCVQGGTVAAGWHLVTATFDGVTATLYVDNIVVASDSFTAPPNTAYALYIGRYFGGNGYGWNGAIDEVYLYDRPLTATEIDGLYFGNP